MIGQTLTARRSQAGVRWSVVSDERRMVTGSAVSGGAGADCVRCAVATVWGCVDGRSGDGGGWLCGWFAVTTDNAVQAATVAAGSRWGQARRGCGSAETGG